MVEAKIFSYEIDPYEPLEVRQNVKMPADEDIPLRTKPSHVVREPNDGLKKYICHFCTSIVVDPVSDSSCGYCFCRVCAAASLGKESVCLIPICGEIFD